MHCSSRGLVRERSAQFHGVGKERLRRGNVGGDGKATGAVAGEQGGRLRRNFVIVRMGCAASGVIVVLVAMQILRSGGQRCGHQDDRHCPGD